METRQDVLPCIENRASGGTEICYVSVCARVNNDRSACHCTSAPLPYRDK